MFRKFLWLIILLMPCILNAQSIDKKIKNRSELFSVFVTENELSKDLEYNMVFSYNQDNNTSKKSSFKAALLSGILPGSGQLYAGDKIKAAGFLVAELSLWYSHFHLNGKGDDLEADFRRYADQYWIKEDYFLWIIENNIDITKYSHTLPSTNTQQYYEMIGKYDQFLAGWIDATKGPLPSQSPLRLKYMADQHYANKQFKRADLMAQLLVVNRVVSAFEAAFSLHRKNSNFSSSFRFERSPANAELVPFVNMKLSW
ncbi:hypothetical protein ACFL7D_03680 [candidate division KSB1 bacterium]